MGKLSDRLTAWIITHPDYVKRIAIAFGILGLCFVVGFYAQTTAIETNREKIDNNQREFTEQLQDNLVNLCERTQIIDKLRANEQVVTSKGLYGLLIVSNSTTEEQLKKGRFDKYPKRKALVIRYLAQSNRLADALQQVVQEQRTLRFPSCQNIRKEVVQ